MSPQMWWLNDREQLVSFSEWVQGRISQGMSTTVMLRQPDRSADQNAKLHDVIHMVAMQKEDETEAELKRYVKLHFGVPILRGSDPIFRERYDSVIKDHLSYEQKLQAMDLLPVTSQMNKAQFGQLLDEVIRHYTNAGYVIDH